MNVIEEDGRVARRRLANESIVVEEDPRGNVWDFRRSIIGDPLEREIGSNHGNDVRGVVDARDVFLEGRAACNGKLASESVGYASKKPIPGLV